MAKKKDSSDFPTCIHVGGTENGAKILVTTKNEEQKKLLKVIKESTITFVTGPAGTGKTYLSVYQGLQYIYRGIFKRLVFTRPIIEAGENLGFLPGDVMEKVEPYMMPIFQTLNKLVSQKELNKLMTPTKEEDAIIKIIPFAYMRGITFDNSFCVVDEAQNTTPTQMRMLLTRIGENSKMVICGDLDQSDLDNKNNGLWEASQILRNIEQIGFVELTEEAIVRNPIIQKIEQQYRQYKIKSNQVKRRGVCYYDPNDPLM